MDTFKDIYRENHHALSNSSVSKDKKADLAEKFYKSQNKAVDYLQIAIYDVLKKTIELRMRLIFTHGQFKESSRSNLFVKTRVKLQCAEHNLRKARKILGRTTETNAKGEIKKSIVAIAVGYKTLKSAIAELKSDARKVGVEKKNG